MSYTQPEMTLYSYTYIFGIASYILYIYPILHTYEKSSDKEVNYS